jgi:hypothetical protein
VINASPQVRTLLSLTKLDTLLITNTAAPPLTDRRAPLFCQAEHSGVNFEVYEIARDEALSCVTVGDASLLATCGFREKDCQKVGFPESSLAFGLGAFGGDFQDCRARFGEFLSVAGAAAYLPTDGTNVPDYMLAAEKFIPEFQVLYCAKAEGRFAKMGRFEANKESGTIPLGDLVNAGFEIAESDTVGVVIVAETAGLLGVSLRRSPVSAKESDRGTGLFDFPTIRHWLSYSPERAHGRSLALITGIAAKTDSRQGAGKLLSMLRPLGKASWPAGHFHAAAFPYRPLKKGALDLKATITALFEDGNIENVMHLLNDTREFTGSGESEFVRGACWFGPITKFASI